MANLGVGSSAIYQSYVESGGNTSQLAARIPLIEFQNGMVGMQVKSLGGDFQPVRQHSSPGRWACRSRRRARYYGLVDGWAPVNELPTIAEMPQTMAGRPG